jgi:hypothetical protein
MKFLLMILLCFSCTTTHEKLDASIKYRMDMGILNDGQRYIGTAVMPKKEIYDLDFLSPGTLSLFTFTSCSRDIAVEQESGKIIDRKKVNIQYVPNIIEKRGGCPVYLAGFEKVIGRHTWGMIDFQDDLAVLPARVTCDGKSYRSEGVTVCQTRAGLTQRMEFDSKIFVRPQPGCEIEVQEDYAIEWDMKEGSCAYIIQEAVSPYRQHRLTTYGYVKVILREG